MDKPDAILRRLPAAAATLLAAVALALTAAACSGDDPDEGPEPPGQTERTLLMYLPWSTDLTSYFENNISEMGQAALAHGLDGERVLVYMCTAADAAVLFELLPDGQECRRQTLKTYQSPEYTTAGGIASMLRDVRSLAPARSYAMTIGCHGMGWVPVNEAGSRAAGEPPRPHWQYAGGPLTRYFGGFTKDVQTDVVTLAEGIELADMHMEFILFDDCFMSSVEAAYDLRHAADWLIACPTEIMARGMPYDAIGAHLLGTPDYAAVCSEFLSFYSSYSYPYGTIGVTRTDQLDSLARVVRKIEAAGTLDSALRPYLQRMDGYSPPIFYDLGDYIAAICTDEELLAEFNAQLARTVPYKAHTSSYYSAITGAEPIRAYSGITTSAPTRSRYADDWRLTEWYAATH